MEKDRKVAMVRCRIGGVEFYQIGRYKVLCSDIPENHVIAIDGPNTFRFLPVIRHLDVTIMTLDTELIK